MVTSCNWGETYMNSLYEALYRYAAECRVQPFLHPSRGEEADTLTMIDNSMDYLRALGPGAADHADRVKSGMETLSYINEEALFLAGLSIGLELGALGQNR